MINLKEKKCIPNKQYDIYVINDSRVRRSLLFSIKAPYGK